MTDHDATLRPVLKMVHTGLSLNPENIFGVLVAARRNNHFVTARITARRLIL